MAYSKVKKEEKINEDIIMIKYFISGLLRRGIVLTENFKKGEKALKIVELCRVSCESEALAIKSLLSGQGIKCMFKANIDHSVYPFTVDGLGEVRIMVISKDLEESKKILELYTKPSKMQ